MHITSHIHNEASSLAAEVLALAREATDRCLNKKAPRVMRSDLVALAGRACALAESAKRLDDARARAEQAQHQRTLAAGSAQEQPAMVAAP